MNKPAIDALVKRLIGAVPSRRHSIIKGAISGGVLFMVFEYLSVINSNLPRVPVSWLMMAAAIMVESVLFFRIVPLLTNPRRADMFFIFRICCSDRITIARSASRKAHEAFIPFIGACLAVAAVLELLLLHEHSVIILCALPCISMAVMTATAFLFRSLLKRQLVPCTHRDAAGMDAAVKAGSRFRRQIAKVSVRLARAVSRLVPGNLQLVVMRNLLYLLRGEIVLTILVTFGAPVILAVILLLIHDASSPFITMLPLVAVFMMNSHFTSELSEASQKLTECFWYDFRTGILLRGHLLTLALPAIPLLIVTMVVMVPHPGTATGLVRLVNLIVAMTATLAIGCRSIITVRNNDSDPLMSLILFAVIAVGNFIPWVGFLFSGAAVLVMVLLDWEILRGTSGKRAGVGYGG